MATNVLLPALGFDMTHGAIARWLKKEGDAVKQGEPIAEIETDKATVEIQAFASGVLQKILVAPGNSVPVGTVIGIIAEPGEPSPSFQTSPTIEPNRTPDRDVGIASSRKPLLAMTQAQNGWIKASPLARNLAREKGVPLAEIAGTGPNGRIVQRDVETFLARGAKTAPIKKPEIISAPIVAGETVQLSRIRQTIARRMTESKTTVPHFYVTFDINMTNAMNLREQLNALAKDDEKISVNDLVIAATARTLKQWRMFNASYRGDKLEMHSEINIGIAVAVEDGLITPVLHDADKKTLKEIARESKALTARTRASKMRPEDLSGGTFTVSNLGMFGVDEFSAIINPPEAAILAVAGVRKTPVVVADAVVIAQMMKATLSVDHRVADGVQAAQMMRDLKLLLENPVNLLLSE
ncbi:MAG: 2-oxo acid dehydrogenase subunit E2 [Chloroflexi bacterium]|nr:2-oxo acid dehydrogenase subunit E2 [Chloroflexota bacterium]